MRLDPISLRLFVAVMEEGTIADAAAREHLAASAVSKRISELEGALAALLAMLLLWCQSRKLDAPL